MIAREARLMMNEQLNNFGDFFQRTFGYEPFDYQKRLATDEGLYSLVNVPTGAGKTAAVIGAWLWRRLSEPASVGRRLVYCLPMRTLVEQTRSVAERAIDKLQARLNLNNRFSVHTLMGGDVNDEWDMHPESECILIGSQDMLLSRALNRGYAMSRFRWPVHFGLLNNDCLWVFDEIQLMGDGLATSAQLTAFREQFGTFGKYQSIWISATLDSDWLKTIDFAQQVDELKKLELSDADRASSILAKRLHAKKNIKLAPPSCRNPEGLAKFVKENHSNGSQTLVVVNRVARARETFAALEESYYPKQKKSKKGEVEIAANPNTPELMLIHSRFRPNERKEWTQKLNSKPNSNGRIIVATQVVEAGVDISSRLLFTDIAPYASMVQRFGRCNRTGEESEAHIFWIDRPLNERDAAKLADKTVLDEKEREKVAAPYDWRDLETAQGLLNEMQSAAPADLEKIKHHDPFNPAHVLRRRDLIDLFDTTTDLSGYDLDVSRFVRGGDERDVSVAWRKLNGNVPAKNMPRLQRDELCAVAIGDFKEFLKAKDRSGKARQAWQWNALEGVWQKVADNDLRPGLTLLLDTNAGGYDVRRGWNANSKEVVVDVHESGAANEANDDDPLTYLKYTQALAAHSREAKAAAEMIVAALDDLKLDEWRNDLIFATHHHDWGKVHAIFQETLHKGLNEVIQSVALAKSTSSHKHTRKRFRHELASALALLQEGTSDLVVYLAACHHGKVRLSIRALPDETKPGEADRRFARGIWQDEILPATDLGDGTEKPEIKLDLEPMLLGASEKGEPSWLERMINLRDRMGVFRLAYLECLIRAADVRASADPKDYWHDGPSEEKR
jgi:CRISPR-associated endonuclease/helicase Cas3